MDILLVKTLMGERFMLSTITDDKEKFNMKPAAALTALEEALEKNEKLWRKAVADKMW